MTATTETFGHEPVWIDEGYCGSCERCGNTEEREVCARCSVLIPMSPGPWKRDSVNWPCTSALVLGIEPREEAGQ